MKRIFLAAFFSALLFPAIAQKSDYKKLQRSEFPLEMLEPFVEEYPDFVPARLKLAERYESSAPEKALEHYRKVLPMITEAEIKSNKKFYQEYQQRDYRSGKMVVSAVTLRDRVREKITQLDAGAE